MKFVVISDTHNKHKELELPQGDVLLHAGDVSGRGYEKEIGKFLQWFSAQPFQYKIFIAGNHDFFFEKATEKEIQKLIPPDVIYLNDSGTNIEGIQLWGSPVQPWFYDWAFNRQRGAEIRKHWEIIPKNTDILITHGPPYGVLDQTVKGQAVGCEELIKFVQEIQPRFHVFGHIHEAFGVRNINGTTYINASILDEKYQLVHQPVSFNY